MNSDQINRNFEPGPVGKMLHWKPVGHVMLHTSESLVAWCDGEGALLHSQLVKLGELWRDSSRGRLWEWERRQGEKRRKWKTQEEGKTEQKKSQLVKTTTTKNSQKQQQKERFHTLHHSMPWCVDFLSYHKALHGLLVSVCFMACLYRVPQRYSSTVQAASLGKAFS